jgi:hypothetical protein
MADEQDPGFAILDDGGTTHQFPAGFDPQKAALIVSRSYGDERAAANQQKTTAQGQFSVENALHDLGQAGVGAWDTLKGFAKTAWKDPLMIGTGSQQQLTPEQLNKLQNTSLSDVMHQSVADLRKLGGTLRTKAQDAGHAIANPWEGVDAAAAHLPTPDRAAQLVGSGAVIAALPKVLPNAGRAVSSTGRAVTAVGEGIPATVAGGIGGTIGGVLSHNAGGASVGASIGATVPATLRGTGRLITATGNLMQGPKLAAAKAAAEAEAAAAAAAAAPSLEKSIGQAVDSGQLRQMPEDMSGVSRNNWGYTRSPEGQRIANDAAAAREARRAAIVKNLAENPPPPTPPKPEPAPPLSAIPGARTTGTSAVPQQPAPTGTSAGPQEPAPPTGWEQFTSRPAPPPPSPLVPGVLATGTSAVPQEPAPVGWEQFSTRPAPPEPPPPSPLIPGAVATGSSAVPQEPAPVGWEQFSTRPAPSPIPSGIPGAASTGSGAVSPGPMPTSWEQFTTRPARPAPPIAEAAAAPEAAAAASEAAAAEAAAPEGEAAAADVPPAASPHGDLTPDELNMIRQLAAENDSLRFTKHTYVPGGARTGGDITVVGGSGGAKSLGLIEEHGGYGSRQSVLDQMHNIIDGVGTPNKVTKAIIEAARARLAGEGGPGDLPPDAGQWYETPREGAARMKAGAPPVGTATAEPPLSIRDALVAQVRQYAKETGVAVDEEALQTALADKDGFLGDLVTKYAQGAEDVTFDPTEIQNEQQGRIPGTEGARQVGKPPTMHAPQQASSEDFELDARTPAEKAAADAAAAERAKGPDLFGEKAAPTDEMLRQYRHDYGARDGAAKLRQMGYDVDEQTLRDLAPDAATDKTGHRGGQLSLEGHARIQGKVAEMIKAGATDEDLRGYMNKANTDKAKSNILQIIRAELIKSGRTPFAVAGAAAGGAALRQALVNKLQDQEQ